MQHWGNPTEALVKRRIKMKGEKESEISRNVALKSSNAVSSGNPIIEDRLLPHFVELRNLFYESVIFQCVYAAANAGIADVLSSDPKSSDDIAEATGNNPDAIYRLMRALAGIGIFRETSERMFKLTPKAELLQESHPASLRPIALLTGGHFYRGPWGNIMYSIETGGSSFEYTFKRDIFSYTKEHEDAMNLFQRALTAFTIINCPVIADSYPFFDFRKVIDIGGGRGSLLAHILKQHPSVNGILFDLPEVVKEPNEIDREISERCEIVGGDFFKAVPEGGDLYIMQQVIHNWDDELAIKILTNCRRAMAENGKLLVIDAVLEPENKHDLNKFQDITMLLINKGARERSEQDFRKLFKNAGLELTRIISTDSILSVSILEVKKQKRTPYE
jgi:SAM-dependent methyltransferase